ncbi:hypothetical protein [Thiocapsa sp.]|uniref:hypothetical protein n=1 Tax=Thiocapsa sp. TaxID=2024551 RepID=UPI00262161C3|nr:hypothetical protein [Thiocapsa sp.]
MLADTDPRFRPEHYSDDLWGCSINFRFPMVKLIDWDTPEAWPALEASNNPFALVVMAQIRCRRRRPAVPGAPTGRGCGTSVGATSVALSLLRLGFRATEVAPMGD